jgi:hypothetical protein
LGVLNIDTQRTECIRIAVPLTPVDVRKVLANALKEAKLWNVNNEEDILDVLFATCAELPSCDYDKKSFYLSDSSCDKSSAKAIRTSKYSEHTPLLIILTNSVIY